MKNTKFVFNSKTIIGALVALAAMVKLIWGVDVSEGEITTLLGDLDTVVNVGLAIISQVLIIYGRFTAEHKLSLK